MAESQYRRLVTACGLALRSSRSTSITLLISNRSAQISAIQVLSPRQDGGRPAASQRSRTVAGAPHSSPDQSQIDV